MVVSRWPPRPDEVIEDTACPHYAAGGGQGGDDVTRHWPLMLRTMWLAVRMLAWEMGCSAR